MAAKNYYDILQVSPSADPEVIQAVYRRLARKHHPDASGDAEMMKLINEAYAVLSDSKRRAAYDKKRPASSPRLKKTDKLPIYQSDLHRERESWLMTLDDYCETEQRGGYFHLVITQPARAACKVLPIPLYDLEIKVTASLPRTNGKGAECGLIFRRSDDGFYKFAMHRDGYYSFSACYKDKWSRLIDRQHSDLFENGDNKLMVKAVGRKIKLGVNGELLASLQDDKLLEGRVGIFAATGEEEMIASARFKDLSVYQVQKKEKRS